MQHASSSQGFYHYYRVMDRAVQRSKQPMMDIGVVYLTGTIGEVGEFDAASVSPARIERVKLMQFERRH